MMTFEELGVSKALTAVLNLSLIHIYNSIPIFQYEIENRIKGEKD